MKKLLLVVALVLVTLTVTAQHSNKEILDAGLIHLEIDSVHIYVRMLNKHLKDEARSNGATLKAHISGKDGQYLLQVGHLHKHEQIKILAHELLHLKQIEEGRLKKVGNTVEFDGKLYDNIVMIPYHERPWEKDAHRHERELAKNIRLQLSPIVLNSK